MLCIAIFFFVLIKLLDQTTHKVAVSLVNVDSHLTFLRGVCRYVWVNYSLSALRAIMIWRTMNIRIKSGEPGFLGFSVPGWLGIVICKPEGAA